MAGLREVLSHDPRVLPTALVQGLSWNTWLAVALVAAIVVSIPAAPDRSIARWFDLPMIATMVAIALGSLVVPVVKSYTVVLVLVPLVAGLMLRARHSMLNYSLLCVLMITNASVHVTVLFEGHPGVLNGRPWRDAAAFVEARADRECSVLVHPEYRDLSATAWFVDEVSLSPLSEPAPCSCERRWFIVNHVWTQEQRTEVLSQLDDPVIEADWGEAFVGTASCRTTASAG